MNIAQLNTFQEMLTMGLATQLGISVEQQQLTGGDGGQPQSYTGNDATIVTSGENQAAEVELTKRMIDSYGVSLYGLEAATAGSQYANETLTGEGKLTVRGERPPGPMGGIYASAHFGDGAPENGPDRTTAWTNDRWSDYQKSAEASATHMPSTSAIELRDVLAPMLLDRPRSLYRQLPRPPQLSITFPKDASQVASQRLGLAIVDQQEAADSRNRNLALRTFDTALTAAPNMIVPRGTPLKRNQVAVAAESQVRKQASGDAGSDTLNQRKVSFVTGGGGGGEKRRRKY